MRAFVTGAGGYIGRQLVSELIGRGWRVAALVRNPASCPDLHPEATVIEGDVRDTTALEKGLEGSQIVFHLAAPITGTWSEHEATTVSGTRTFMQLAAQRDVSRFIFISSLAVYDKTAATHESVIDEDWPVLRDAPQTNAYARARVKAETAVRELNCARMTATTLRLGLVYDAKRFMFPHLGELVGQRRVAFGSPSLRLPLLEMGSAVDAMIAVACSPYAHEQVYQVVDDDQVTRAEYLRLLEELTEHSMPVLYVRTGMVAALCDFAAALKKLPGTAALPALSGAKIRQRAVEPRYDSTRLKRDTNWQGGPRVADALRRALRVDPARTPTPIRRVGLIGAGRIAHLHLQALRRIPGLEITGILDSNIAAARHLCAANKLKLPCFSDADAFYAQARPESVHVLTPPSSHAAIAERALAQGAHVLLEKPAVATTAECDRLVTIAAQRGVSIAVDENVAWEPVVRRACALLHRGVLGELIHVDAWMSFDVGRARVSMSAAEDGSSWITKLPGGILEDLLPHPLSVLLALTGRELEVAHAELRNSGRLRSTFPDELRLACSGRGSITAALSMSLSARPDEFVVRIYGSRATVQVDIQNMLIDCNTPIPGPRSVARGIRAVRSGARILGQTGANAVRIALGRAVPPGSPLHLLRSHYRALATGKPIPTPLARCRRTVEIARTIWPCAEPKRQEAPEDRAAATSPVSVADR